jgi:hypothetical protein
MLLGGFAPVLGSPAPKVLLLSQAQPAQRRTPGLFLSSVLLWKIAPAHRVADGGGRVEGP